MGRPKHYDTGRVHCHIVRFPTLSIAALKGTVKPIGRPLTLEEMEGAAIEGAVARFKGRSEIP
jgi:hypothetical protein